MLYYILQQLSGQYFSIDDVEVRLIASYPFYAEWRVKPFVVSPSAALRRALSNHGRLNHSSFDKALVLSTIEGSGRTVKPVPDLNRTFNHIHDVEVFAVNLDVRR